MAEADATTSDSSTQRDAGLAELSAIEDLHSPWTNPFNDTIC